MIFQKTITMIPLLLGLSSNTLDYKRTQLSFNEDDIKNNLVNVSENMLSYNQLSNSFMFDRTYLKTRFDYYYQKWNDETMILSKAKTIIDNDNFKKIVSYGTEIVPIILEELSERPSNLVWALNHILNGKVSKKGVTISEASNAWVKWGRANQII